MKLCDASDVLTKRNSAGLVFEQVDTMNLEKGPRFSVMRGDASSAEVSSQTRAPLRDIRYRHHLRRRLTFPSIIKNY